MLFTGNPAQPPRRSAARETDVVIIRIYTEKFIPQLKAWIDDTQTGHKFIESAGEGICIADVPEGDFKTEALVDLFEDLTILSNDAIQESKALKDAVRKKMKEYRSIIMDQLGRYFEMYSDISIEGFICFRLWEYSHIINILLYSLAKKELAAYKYFLT